MRLLSAVLREQGFEAPILFFKGWRNNDVRLPTEHEYRLLEEHIQGHAPDVIGIGFGTPYLALVRQMTRRIRAISEAHIVWGGVHPTIMPEDCIEHADSVCIGEGEGPLTDLARALEQGQPVDGIDNLWVRTADGQVIKNKLRPLLQDLDALPHDQLTRAEMAVIDQGQASTGDPNGDNVLYRVFASRGCPFRCSYCYNSQFREIFSGCGRYHRQRSVANVITELEAARASLPGLRRIRFDDDSFVFPRAWIEELAEQYPRRVGLPFDLLLNPMVAKEWMLRKLRAAGLVHVQVGIQSGSAAERQEHYNRNESSEQILALAHTLRELGIEVTYDIILDNPLAGPADQEGMLDLLLRLPRPFNLFLYSLVVF
ncbi:MAG: cobalamin-dependent protein, partial [Myxococcota bacterium]|nr:cobalamin-dependent protein [Myxococcota bacterium]